MTARKVVHIWCDKKGPNCDFVLKTETNIVNNARHADAPANGWTYVIINRVGLDICPNCQLHYGIKPAWERG